MMGFTFRLEEVGSTAIVSSVTGTLTADLNNTMISCRDGLFPAGQAETQQFTAIILGEFELNILGDLTLSFLEKGTVRRGVYVSRNSGSGIME